MNFVSKFVGIVRFRNDHIARIMRYGDYQLGNVTISRVYYVEGLGHNLFFVGQFCDADLEVAFQKNTCFIHNLEGVDLISGSRNTNLYTYSLGDKLKTSLMCLLSKALKTKSWLLHRRLSHLNFGKLDAKVDINIFVGYTPVKKAFIIYNKRAQKIIKTIHVTFDELTAMASEQLGSGPTRQCITPAISSSGLVPNTVSQQPCILPNRDYWDHSFQPMFDEYFNPSTITVSPVLVPAAPRAVDLANSHVSMSINQDASSASTPSTQEQEHSTNIYQGFKESPKHHIFMMIYFLNLFMKT
uniref:Retrovirus-related Pol polyprotein from transposon TNT 1-94 n=1 Tax=Tanacetum cinerariifolium TaxID=118510 RepID=A0A6L2J503_TANCI|nr:retrovirus-related Pol polyprotein from transposon TNT 1-94 [Tanacetum cinerariifolium]